MLQGGFGRSRCCGSSFGFLDEVGTAKNGSVIDAHLRNHLHMEAPTEAGAARRRRASGADTAAGSSTKSYHVRNS